MNKFFLPLCLVTLILSSCEQGNRPHDNRNDRTTSYGDNTSRDSYTRDTATDSQTNRDSALRRDTNMTTTTDRDNDTVITRRIQEVIIQDSSLSPSGKAVKIFAENGVVTLSGTVLNEREKDTIEQKINRLPGVKRVENRLEVQK